MSVNNKDIIQMHLGYNWLTTQKTLPINASFVKQLTMASGYVHLLTKHSFEFFRQYLLICTVQCIKKLTKYSHAFTKGSQVPVHKNVAKQIRCLNKAVYTVHPVYIVHF